MASDKEVQMIMSLTGVDETTASDAYLRYESVEDAIDSLLPKPAVAGDKYIPPKPTIDSGLTPEQKALCERGRWLQEKVNVVFSVAHSKSRTLQDEDQPEVPAHGQVPPSSPELTLVQSVAVPELQEGSDAQTTQ